ncbi:hypothetical protein H1R20_g16246, partial [Candolleomyces eurysporus]
MTVRMSPNVASFKRVDEIKSTDTTTTREIASDSVVSLQEFVDDGGDSDDPDYDSDEWDPVSGETICSSDSISDDDDSDESYTDESSQSGLTSSSDEDQIEYDSTVDIESDDPPSPITDPIFFYYKGPRSNKVTYQRGNPNTVIEANDPISGNGHGASGSTSSPDVQADPMLLTYDDSMFVGPLFPIGSDIGSIILS